MKTPVFTGTCTAMITPFTLTGEVDYGRMKLLLERQIAAGIDGVCICGTTGESATLSHAEHMTLIDFAVKQVAGRCKVIAGTGSNDTATSLLLSQHAADSGADALLVVTPYYNKTTQNGLIAHYTYLADRSASPLILYNVPSRTGLSFTAESYQVLSEHPNINGVKEASGNFSLIAKTAALCGDRLNIWSGNDDQTVAMMALGAKGLISVTSNLLPKGMTELTRAYHSGNHAQAARLQLGYLPLMDALFSEVNPIPVKAALETLGLDSGHLRMPLCKMSGEAQSALLAILQEYRQEV